MSPNKRKMMEALKERGFTGEFEFFYWPHDGWYIHCDQMAHEWGGFNTPDVVRQIEKGFLDRLLPKISKK